MWINISLCFSGYYVDKHILMLFGISVCIGGGYATTSVTPSRRSRRSRGPAARRCAGVPGLQAGRRPACRPDTLITHAYQTELF